MGSQFHYSTQPGRRKYCVITSYSIHYTKLYEDALARGAQKVVIGIGGSSTNDCGIGMAAALGVQFLDKDGKEVKPVGGEMINVTDIDLSGLYPAVRSADFEVACDVDNPLIGEKGAARVYGPSYNFV